MTDSEHFDLYLPTELIILTEGYLLKDVKYLADMYGVFSFSICEDYYAPVKEVLRIADKHFGSFDNTRKSRVTLKEGNVIFCGKRLRLTKSEMRILRLFLYSDKRYDARAVAAYCLNGVKASSATAVSHISSINKKARFLTGLDIISGKRYEGYTLNMI